MSKYDDIINLPHHVSSKHIPMSMESRAAQFAPFAALNGHDEAINEISRRIAAKNASLQDEVSPEIYTITDLLEDDTPALNQELI